MFTDAEKADIRRFCGYGLYGTANPTVASGYRFSTAYGVLEYKMNNMGPEEEAVARDVYLANLTTLQTGILGAADNLDTAQAAVWTWNRNEVRDRTALYTQWRRDFCGFLGIPPGPDLGAGGSVSLVV